MTVVACVASTFLALLLLMCRLDGVRRTGQELVLLGAAALPWSAVELHGVPVGDIPLVAGAATLALANAKTFWVPGPVVVAGISVAIAAGLSAMFPPSSTYLNGRGGVATATGSLASSRSSGNLTNLWKFEIAIFVVPAIVCMACRGDRRFPRRLMVSWVIGIVASILVGLSDARGVTHVSMSLLGYVPASGRQSGLSAAPNTVGVQSAMALPLILLTFQSRRRRTRLLGVLGVAACGTGVYLSGSRGSAVVLLLATVTTVVLVPSMRRWTLRFVGLATIGVLYLSLSGVGARLLEAVRLSGQASTVGDAQSDEGRRQLAIQGLKDFTHSPVFGIGFGHLDEAHVIYIQLLAAGGVITAAAFLVLVTGVCSRAVKALPTDDLTLTLVASVVTWLLVGLVENQLADQWLYVPIAGLVGLLTWHKTANVTESVANETFGPRAAILPYDRGRGSSNANRPPAENPSSYGTTALRVPANPHSQTT